MSVTCFAAFHVKMQETKPRKKQISFLWNWVFTLESKIYWVFAHFLLGICKLFSYLGLYFTVDWFCLYLLFRWQ